VEYNLAQVFSAVAAANPDRDCIVFGHRRFTYSQTAERARRFARALHSWGLGADIERDQLAPHESGQSHLAVYLANCNEYLEGMLGAYLARVAPFNVNYRYVADELVYLLGNAGAKAVLYQARFAPTLALALEKARDQLPAMKLIHVDDDSGNEPLPGAVRYEELLALNAGGVSDEPLDLPLSPDDLYVLYTGGTTGMPKAVLWRQHDIYMNAMGGRPPFGGEPVTSLEDIVERSRLVAPGSMTCAPLMHGAAQWAAFINLCGGKPFVMAPTTTHFDPAEAWALASRERVMSLSFVGDAFGRPLADALESGDYDLSGLLILVTGGAALSAPLKQRFLELLPHVTILDAGGSSESGNQMGQLSSNQQGGSGRFAPNPGAVVVSEDLTRILSPGDDEIGWLAQQGRIPLGYLGDAEKTARTFPVIDGIRHSVPGDRARWFADGEIELLGRDSVTINSGGEKIFAEEVEAAIAEHAGVYDVVVTSRPSARWGNEVVAIVALVEGETADADSIIAEAARHLARYKLPKAVVFRDRLQRSPSGKADYRWAKEQAAQ
jgi:3-oxocholest-4-en-26-oate---CoA ligase